VVQLGAIHKPRTWDTGHSARPIRDVPCATLRAFAAEVERKPALYSERLEKRSSSWRPRSAISKRQPLRVRGIFQCYWRGDLSSLFRGRKPVRFVRDRL